MNVTGGRLPAGSSPARGAAELSSAFEATPDASFEAMAGASVVAPPTIATIFSEGRRMTSKIGRGYRPIQRARMTRGASVSCSRNVRSASFSFAGFVTSPKNTRW